MFALNESEALLQFITIANQIHLDEAIAKRKLRGIDNGFGSS